jgi:hypothetical protein
MPSSLMKRQLCLLNKTIVKNYYLITVEDGNIATVKSLSFSCRYLVVIKVYLYYLILL